MPKLLTKIIIDEEHLVKLIKMKPELYDPFNELANDNNRIKVLWEEISNELDASVNDVKRAWKKLKINYNKRCKDQGLRKSTRLNLMDKNLDFLEINRVDANETSPCIVSNTTSDNCESTKRVLRSGWKLSAITETEPASSSMSLFNPNKTQTIIFHSNEHHEPTINNTNNDQTTNRKDFVNNGEPANNGHQKDNNEGTRANVDKSNRTLRSRQVELLTVASKENRAPLRSTKIISTLSKNKQKKLINFNNATRSFFESMAMTVSTFPAQDQALIKMEICNIVAKTERKLSMENKI